MDGPNQLTSPPSPDVARFQHRVVVATRVLADVLAVFTAFLISYHVYEWMISAKMLQSAPPSPAPYVSSAVGFCFFTVLTFSQLGLYRERVSVLNLWELQTAVRGVVLAAAWFFAMLFFLVASRSVSRVHSVGAIALAMILIVLERRLLSTLIGKLERRWGWARRIVIGGCGPSARLLMKKIVHATNIGGTVVGFLDDTAPVGSSVSCRVAQTGSIFFQAPVLGRWREWQQVIGQYQVDELLVCSPSLNPERLREVLQFSRAHGLRVGVVPHFDDVRADQLEVDDLSAIPVLRPQTVRPRRVYLFIKRLCDLIGALALILVTAPVWIIAAIALAIDSPGPVFFVQERVGLNGRIFRMFKFRTMWRDATRYAPSPQGDLDPRITRVGRLLRTGGLDELPQLLNVLSGDMSLVGPRPEMPFIVQGYSELERQRLQVKPGITGLWQLSADRHAEIHENIEYDLYYVSHRTVVVDLLILLETLFFTLGLVGKAAKRRAPQELKPAPLPTDGRTADGNFLLVAFDQRRNADVPSSWHTLLPAAYALANRWPLKVLAAVDNVATFDILLDEPIRRLGMSSYRTEYVPYHGRTELRLLSMNATLVITDLPHVAQWATEAGVSLLSVHDDGLRWSKPSLAADELANVLRNTGLQHPAQDALKPFGRDEEAALRA